MIFFFFPQTNKQVKAAKGTKPVGQSPSVFEGVTAILHPDHKNFNETEYAARGTVRSSIFFFLCCFGCFFLFFVFFCLKVDFYMVLYGLYNGHRILCWRIW